MRKGIFKFNLISAFIFLGLIFSACTKQTSNATQNSDANKAVEEASAQAGNSNSELLNTTVNNENSNTETKASPDKAGSQKVIERYIAGVAKVSDAEEYKEARKIIYGDLDGDGDEDAAAQFTIEGMGGGNNYAFYLAVFRNENGSLRAVTDEVVGGKLSRDVTMTKIENGKIFFDTKELDEDDGACCPSIEGKTMYILENNKLKESKTGGKK